MAPSSKLMAVLALVMLDLACSNARDPAKGFRLAGTCDSSRGKAALLEFECNRCHEVTGADLPRPAVQRIVLGGSVIHMPSDGYLVTAIINPTYHAGRYPNARPGSDGLLPMPYYAERMTVQQLTDIVCYLRTRYSLSPMPVRSEYP